MKQDHSQRMFPHQLFRLGKGEISSFEAEYMTVPANRFAAQMIEYFPFSPAARLILRIDVIVENRHRFGKE